MTDLADGAFDIQDRSGSVLAGKYRLEKLLGEGGMASVYRATHRNGSRVAIKILHRVLSVDKDIRERFLYEGYAANAAGHKGAVHVIDDAVADDGSVFLVMEYLDGVCVNDLWERRDLQLSPQVSLSIVHGLLDILVTAHSNRVIHRDIKPENIFITGDGDIKLLDFGIARLPQSMRSSTPTETGARLGTPAFMPPEQARGNVRDIDARSDIYGVGAVLFTLMSGQYIYDCSNPSEYLIKAATEPARPLSSLLPDIPAAVGLLVDKALAFNKEERWESAAVMLEAVRAASEEHYGGVLTQAQLAELGQPAAADVLDPAGPSAWIPQSASSENVDQRGLGETRLAPTLAASGAGLSTTGSEVASVRTASFAKKPSPSRHLWLLGFAAIILLAFSGAVVLGARSVANSSSIGPTPDVSTASALDTASAAPVLPPDPPPTAAAASSAAPELAPPASASAPSSPPPGPSTRKTSTPKRPPAPVPPPTKPAPTGAPPEPEGYDPYLYQ
jgi:eukaryotic-like serine/threonine-protein kinase